MARIASSDFGALARFSAASAPAVTGHKPRNPRDPPVRLGKSCGALERGSGSSGSTHIAMSNRQYNL